MADRRRIVTLGRDGIPPLNPDIINLIPNPSSELVNGFPSFSASTAGQPAAASVRSSSWARFGAWSARYTVARDDGASVVCRTPNGSSGAPIIGGHYFAARVSSRIAALTGATVCDDYRMAIYFYTAAGAAASVPSVSGAAFASPVVGDQRDHYVIGQAPVDAAFASAGALVNLPNPGGAVALTLDVDAAMLVDLGTTFTGPTGAATLASDVPAYGDGDQSGWGWMGTAHASVSASLVSTIKNLEDGVSYYAIQDTFQVKPGTPKPTMAERQRRFGGAVPVAETHDNGSIVWTSFVKSTTADGALARAEEIFTVLRAARRDLYVEWRATNATDSTFYEVRGPATLSPAYKPRQFADSNSWAVDIEIPVAPLATVMPIVIPIASTTLPAVVALPIAIPGSAPALADVTLRTSGGSNPPIWAMIAWAARPAATLASSVAPFGIIEAETAANLSGWTVASDANYRGGSGLKVTASGAGTASGMFALDPSVLAVDDYALSDVDVEVWARVDLAAALVSPKLTLSLQPFAGTAFGGEQFAGDTGGSSGKLLTKPSTGSAFRPVKGGTLSMPVDPTAPLKWNLKVAASWAAGSSGIFGLDYLWLTPGRQRALGPTGKPNDSSYPDFIASTADTQKRIRGGDLSGLVASGAGNFGRTYGLGGSAIELPAGDVDMLFKLSSVVPDDPGVDTTSEQLAHTSVTGSVLVWPRYWLSKGA